MFEIIKNINLEKAYYGCKTMYKLKYSFFHQDCLIEIKIISDNVAYINSYTSGYEALHFFLSQEPDCIQLEKGVSYYDTINNIDKLFLPLKIIYEKITLCSSPFINWRFTTISY